MPPRLRRQIIDGALRDLNEVVTFAEFEPQPGESYLMVRVA